MFERPSVAQLESKLKELQNEVHSKQQIIESLRRSKSKEILRQKSRDVWTRTFDAIDDVVTIQDKDLTIIRANKAAHVLFSAKEGELTSRHCYEVFTGQSDPCPNCPLLTSLRTGKGHSAIIRHDSLVRSSRLILLSFPAGDGIEEYLVHVAHDITKNIETENILQESNQRFSKAFESNPAPMVISEPDSGIFINVNQRWVEMLGYSREELIGLVFEGDRYLARSFGKGPCCRKIVYRGLL